MGKKEYEEKLGGGLKKNGTQNLGRPKERKKYQKGTRERSPWSIFFT